MNTISRYHDICAGHRVHGHENKCAHLHGHNYRFHFKVGANALDHLGRVIDFSCVKATLCQWLEDNWDHKFLLHFADPLLPAMQQLDPDGVIELPFNPTAENMAEYIVRVIGPELLHPYGVLLLACTIEETRKCSATFTL